MQKELSDVLYGNTKKSKIAVSTVAKNPEVEKCQKEPMSQMKSQQDHNVITNVTFNGQTEGNQPVINVYPVINVMGNVPSGLPIIVNLTVNVLFL